jgi:electron transfer flavoprotein beta subunit
MRIVVCVKQVPDTWSEKRLRPDDHTLDRASAEGVVDELDTYALEEALRLKEAAGGESTVVALTMGPATAGEALRSALQIGADEAVHVVDDLLHGSDALATSLVLARAIALTGFDLVVLGSESTDARMGVMAAMLAERLGVAQASLANSITVDSGGQLRVQRVTATEQMDVEADLPAVVSVLDKINEPRYPSFKGIMAAKSKPIRMLTLAELEIEASGVGAAGAATAVLASTQLPPRGERTMITDEKDAATRVATFLASRDLL